MATSSAARVHHSDRDLAAAVRTELASIEPTRRCCQRAERAGLGAAAQGRARSPQVGRLAVRLETVDGSRDFDWGVAAEHCRLAYLRGVVLAHGSLSVGSSGSHLELVLPPDQLAEASAHVAELGLPASARIRRGRGVLTWKGGSAVLDLLRLVGLSSAALEIESRFVGRALNGHLNRVVNAENANLQRAVTAASRQLAEIDTLDRNGGLRRLPTQVRRVATARRRAPEATLAELAASLELSRGQVQRAFEHIADVALHAAGEDHE